MGFTTGFIGGLTTTYALLYLSIHLHRSNRQHQSLLLTQQRTLLTTLYSPPTTFIETPAYEIRKAGIAEELKDRWNRELSSVVRSLQETDWDEVRVRWEEWVSRVWGRVRSSDVGREVETRFKENVVGVGEGVEGVVDGARGEKRLLEVK